MKRQKRVVWMVVAVLLFCGAAQAAVTTGNWDSPALEPMGAGGSTLDVMSVWKSQLVKIDRSMGLVSSGKANSAIGSGLRGKVILGHISLDGLNPSFSTGVPDSFGFIDFPSFPGNVPSFGLVRACPIDIWDGSNDNGNGTIDPGNGTPTVIPAPGAIALGAIGMTVVGWLRRRRVV